MRFQTVHTPTSLTEGPISQALISFALPLLLGNLFQQLYNTADSLIVGNFLGSEALAAVSSSGFALPSKHAWAKRRAARRISSRPP